MKSNEHDFLQLQVQKEIARVCCDVQAGGKKVILQLIARESAKAGAKQGSRQNSDVALTLAKKQKRSQGHRKKRAHGVMEWFSVEKKKGCRQTK